jgi:small GTP-binding protein
MDDQQAFKVVLCGTSFVGKTSILQRYCYGCFNPTMPPTMGADFVAHTVHCASGEVKLHIWDTAGQEHYQAICSLFFRSSSLAFVVYDVTTEKPLPDVQRWIDRVRDTEKNAIIVVFGNKIDLVDEFEQDVAEWCREQEIGHFFCSALTGDGIDDGFLHAAALLRQLWPVEPGSLMIVAMPTTRRCC